MSKVASSNNNKTILDLSVKQQHKHIQSNKDKKEDNKDTNTPIFFIQIGQNMIYFEGESSSQINCDKVDTKRLQKISLKTYKYTCNIILSIRLYSSNV